MIDPNEPFENEVLITTLPINTSEYIVVSFIGEGRRFTGKGGMSVPTFHYTVYIVGGEMGEVHYVEGPTKEAGCARALFRALRLLYEAES